MKDTTRPSFPGTGGGYDNGSLLGGMFPLPTLHEEDSSLRFSRRSAQRRARRINFSRDANETINALNWMAGASQHGGAFRPSLRQQEILDRVQVACRSCLTLPDGTSSPITPEAAFRELLRGSSVYEVAGTTLASFKLERVSLPESVHNCPQVGDLLPDSARQYLEVPERMLKPEVTELDVISQVTPYMDPLLRTSTKHYKALITKLNAIGYLNFTLKPRARAGVFFVKKSDGIRQRLIIDGRRANAMLAEPPSVRLCTAEAFSKFEFLDGDVNLYEAFPGCQSQYSQLFAGLSDIKDAFHRLKQPRWMQELFCLDPVPASWVGLEGKTLCGTVLRGDELVYPMPASLPMGCSWSLYFAQAVSEHLMSQVPLLRDSEILRDRGPPLIVQPTRGTDIANDGHTEEARVHTEAARHYVYVDNLGVLSTSKEIVSDALSQIKGIFEARGLSLHPGEVQSDTIDALGCRLSGTRRNATLKPTRFWRLRQGLRYLLGMKYVSGRVVEVVLGHCTYCSLLNRSLMAVFCDSYKFVRRCYDSRVPLWTSVRQELQAFLGLLPLCTADWAREWNDLVSASDASLSGYGVCTRKLSRDIVGGIGRVPERERFRRGPALGARASALVDTALEDADDDDLSCANLIKAGWEVDASFPEIPSRILRKDLWEVKLHGHWLYPDGILILEAQALLKSLTRIANSFWGQNIRQLLFVDNMAIALAFDRSRSRNFKVLRIIRKFAALCLSRNITCSVRWIPSEYNAADEPSRNAAAVQKNSDSDTACSGGPKAYKADHSTAKGTPERAVVQTRREVVNTAPGPEQFATGSGVKGSGADPAPSERKRTTLDPSGCRPDRRQPLQARPSPAQTQTRPTREADSWLPDARSASGSTWTWRSTARSVKPLC